MKRLSRRTLKCCYLIVGLALLTPFFLPACLDRSVSKRMLASYNVVYETPGNRGLQFETIELEKKNGETLTGWWVPCDRAQGTIIMFHGSLVNLGYQTDYISQFNSWGYQVFVYDYQGFGHSSGEHSVKQLIPEAELVYDYVINRPDVDAKKIAVYGYSLGSPVALSLTSRHPEITGVLVEGLINPEAMIKNNLGMSAPIMLPLIKSMVFPKHWNPTETMQAIGDRPLMLIKRAEDILAADESAFLQANKNNRRFKMFPGASHVSFLILHPEFQEQFKRFYEDCFANAKPLTATLEHINETTTEYIVTVELHGDISGLDGQAAEFYFFDEKKVRSTFYWILEANKTEYRFTIPKSLNGHSTDDATARFNLDGDFPGWSLQAREISLDQAIDNPIIHYGYSNTKKYIKKLRQQEISFKPQDVAISLHYTAVTKHAQENHITGKLIIDDTQSTTATQDFLGLQWSSKQWTADTDYIDVASGLLGPQSNPDTDRLVDEIVNSRGSDWLYSLRRLLQAEGKLNQDVIPIKIETLYGIALYSSVVDSRHPLDLVVTSLELDIPELQIKLQTLLKIHLPDADFLPTVSADMLDADTLKQLKTWVNDHRSELYWNFSTAQYKLESNNEDLYNFQDDTVFEFRFKKDDKLKNIVSLSFDRKAAFGHERRVVTIHHHDPVKALYALFTDNVINMIDHHFPNSKNDFIKSASTKLGIDASKVQSLTDIRNWIEANIHELEWNEELRLYLRKKP